jgi:beta-glucanase (GH16 family)
MTLNAKKTALSSMLILCLFLNLLAVPFAPVGTVLAATLPSVDDFEAGLPAGKDANNLAIGFNTFQDAGSTVAIALTTTPPAAVPGASDPNNVLKLDVSVVSYAGFTHSFENAAVNTWVTQDWSAYAGLSFWLYGNNSGTNLFVDVLDNRNPGSIKDDAERWSVTVPDNFSGWQKIEIPFTSLARKEIGNGAPNDGLGLTEVNGWALGAVTTLSAQTYYVDNAEVYGVAPFKPLTVGFSAISYNVTEGNLATVTAKLSKAGTEAVTVQYKTTTGTAVINRDYAPVAGLLTFPAGIKQQTFSVPTYNNIKYEGERAVVVELYNPSPALALGTPPVARVNIQDNEVYSPTLLDDFETSPYLWSGDSNTTLTNPEIAAGSSLALPGQGSYEHILQAGQKSGSAAVFGRTFATGQDWSTTDGLKFWYYGQNSGQNIALSLTNTTPIVYQHVFMPLAARNSTFQTSVASKPATTQNQTTTDRSSDWALVWSDEFNNPAGTGANPSIWEPLVGDGTAYGIPGWGNDELEYYTAGTANAATNGQGQLQIVTDRADGSLMCYYGPCQYTSARLQTRNRFEVAYGRVEARVKVPQGAGLWPAFWMLGTNIDQAPWPQSGEIDIMEVVGRLPNRVFGTLHGPGYSGGQSYGKTLDLSNPVADGYHTFAVEWQPDKIVWYLDGAPYFTATPNDAFLQGKQWVFNHPFYLLLNTAVGGNFGGAVGANTTFPQTTSVDYVRLYQAKSRSTSFQASFLDDFSGWQQISVPFTAFQGDNSQTPNLAAVRSLSFEVPAGMTSPIRLDQIALIGGKTQMDLPVTFDSPTVNYGLIGFGGADDSTIVSDPTGGSNQVAKVNKSDTAQSWAGTTIATPATPNALGFANKIAFSATRTKMTVRTYSPDAGITVRLKVEDHTDGGIFVETDATTTKANEWETLTFNFAAPDLTKTYDKASIFFNFGVTGAIAGAKTYYFDDVAFPKTQMDLPVTFDSPTVDYGLIGFEGAEDSSIVNDPAGGSNQVGKAIKSATAKAWAGTTISAPTALGFAHKVPFTATATKMTVRTYSPDAGIKVRLKVEDHTNGGIFVETDAMTTKANEWETLIFNFTSPDPANAYDKASIFFNFGVDGATVGAAKTYYFDDVDFVKEQMDLPVTFDSPSVAYGLIGFGGADDSTIVSDPAGGSNQVARAFKSATAELWAGTTIAVPATPKALGFANKIPFTATATTMTVRVYSPDAGITVRLKVEDHTDGNIFVETDVTTTKANEWETLTFNFAAPDLTKTYDKASIFFNFGVTGATAGAKTYYFDDVAFVP